MGSVSKLALGEINGQARFVVWSLISSESLGRMGQMTHEGFGVII